MSIQPIRFNPYQRQTLPTLPQANTVGPSHIYSEAARQLGDIGDIFNSRVLKDKEEAGAKERAEIAAKATVDAAKARASATRHPDWAKQKDLDRQMTWKEYNAQDEEVQGLLRDFNDGPTKRDLRDVLVNLGRISQTELTGAQRLKEEAQSDVHAANARRITLANALTDRLFDRRVKNLELGLDNEYLELGNKSQQLTIMRDVINSPEYDKLFESNVFAGLRKEDLENMLLDTQIENNERLNRIGVATEGSTIDANNAANELAAYTDKQVKQIFIDIQRRAEKASENIDRRVESRGFARVPDWSTGHTTASFTQTLQFGYNTDYTAADAGDIGKGGFHKILQDDPNASENLWALNGYIATAINGLEKIQGPNGEQYFARDWPMNAIRDNILQNPELLTDSSNHKALEAMVHNLFQNANGRTLEQKAQTRAIFDAQVKGLTYDGFYDDIGKLLKNIEKGWNGGVPIGDAPDLSTTTGGGGPLQTLPLFNEYGRRTR